MSDSRRVIGVVTGSRAEFGLLRPVIRAIQSHPALELKLVVTGTHLLPPTLTQREVAAEFPVAGTIEMQRTQATVCADRLADAESLGRGVSGVAAWLRSGPVDVVLVLGDRIEAFAAAAAAAIGGVRVAHMHGGDRAEGIADESMRHAITKLAHIHLPATATSAERIIAMGEEPLSVHLVGSPAVDGLAEMPAMDDEAYSRLGSPCIVLLLHPTGRADDDEFADATRLLRLCMRAGPVLAMHPNHDPGRAGIMRAIEQSGCPACPHLQRESWVGLLRQITVIVGNSSAGLIECAALGLPCVNVGPRQAGREMPQNVIDVPDWDFGAIDIALEQALQRPRGSTRHPYGDGRAGERTAHVLATFDPEHHPTRKRNSY
jgi:UDP-hydrolysing UDP-N-acetyl-D-glucosamine 2-epimerase